MAERLLFQDVAVDNFNELLDSERTALQRRLLTPEEAQAFVVRLNTEHSGVLGRVLKIVCGQVYILGNGDVRGISDSTGRDYSERSNSGLQASGETLRFDVLQHSDELINRGTFLPVSEPCFVYNEQNPMVRLHPQPDVLEYYVPLIRTTRLEPIEQ